MSYEGHADNVSAALLGGVTISYFDGEEIDIVHIPEPKMGAVILVPPEALLTEASRGLLPEQLAHSEATAVVQQEVCFRQRLLGMIGKRLVG